MLSISLSEEKKKFLEKFPQKEQDKWVCDRIKTILLKDEKMTKWLKQHGFSYKKPKATPAKVEPQQQQQLLGVHLELQNKTPVMESAHSTMVTKVTYG